MICRKQNTMLNEPNSLINEVSPYLLQHSYNPVKWHSWSDETLAIAKRENKLLLISIGYSSCHWCHVMESESFNNDEIAEIMNRNYICIKVDREERPDIDQIYMNAVQIITRRGGWPLNCFALPDGRPVYGGTYFPKDQWKNVLESLHETWVHEPTRVIDVASELEQGIANTEIIPQKISSDTINLMESLKGSVLSIKRDLDFKYGGTKGAPKFPMPGLLKFILEYSIHSKDSELQEYITLTLDKIANGGIYDHIGGGFFRYSVDEKWHVPHFEKMLYDNAQLIELFSLAYRINPNPIYQKIVDETIGFLSRELRSPKGGFYSALDADCNGLEGDYYTWQKNELEDILGYDSELFCSAFDITTSGNWEKTNVLKRCITNEQLESIFNIPSKEIEYRIQRCISTIQNVRSKRVPPLIDDKVIVSWNGLLIGALVQAYTSFKNQSYLEMAIETDRYIKQTHFIDGELRRISCKGKVYTEPLLDDYAFYIRAQLLLYSVTLDKERITYAERLLQKTISEFSDTNSGMFFYTPNSNKLFVRKMELIDGVLPSASATMASNLFIIAGILKNNSYKEIGEQMLVNIAASIKSSGLFVYAWIEQFLTQSLPQIHIAISNRDIDDLHYIQNKVIYPSLIIEIKDNIQINGIQICFNNTCQKPEKDLDLIVNQIHEFAIE